MRPSGTAKLKPPALEKYPSSINKNDQATAERITGRFQSLPLPGRIRSILQFVRDIREKPPAEGREREFLERMEGKYDRSILPLTLFRAALIPARIIEGIRLTEGITTRPLTWIDAWNGRKWESVSIDGKAILKDQASLLTLTSDGKPIVDVSGGEINDIRWDINRQIVSQWRLNYERISRSGRFLDRWSLFRLPGEFQQTFRILLLVPMGALLICILRNIIGFPTFGIFMPVLMALAFRNTGAIYGLSLFAGIILIGYAARRLLDRLRLLLVPRMSVLLTLVIICFTLLALFGNKLGLRQVMAVGLLPFVILVMTIERFFVVVEEQGTRTALQTAAGSAAVAFITYFIISWEVLQLTFKEFVVKPACGSGGSGIILITERTENGFLTQSKKTVTPEYLNYHISDILSGIFSLRGQEDHAIIESLIHPDQVFSTVTYQGVPDVRIIVYRGVPVMAMVRLPTKDSDGKANLHRGAIGAGIELRTGKTITAVYKSHIVTHHPDTGNPVSGIQVPYWDTMLSIAALSTDMTGLGYIGVDTVIDRDQGPVLLELNARPGLAIQMANRSGLLKRLEHVDTAPAEIFATPEKRIAWAKENF